MTALKHSLLRQIDRLGPLSVSEYMTQCLYHPDHGYYTQSRPLGKTGDFITAPEISQMFGEMIGLSLAQNWLDQGSPSPFCLAELGPGTGQLMSDILRATASVAGFHAGAQLHLCEINPHLKNQQSQRLERFTPIWIPDTTQLPDLPLFLVANEFFDCLPINQLTKTATGWDEQIIASKNAALCFAHRPAGALTTELPANLPTGSVLELCPAANAIAQDLAGLIANYGGCALICDYGSDGTGDTLQALNNHQKVDVLSEPGTVDLTAHVNFSALKQSITQAKVIGPEPQGLFLERLGITDRAQRLAQNLSDDALENHISAHRRLTHPDEMGDLFKMMALVPQDAPAPVGFGQ
jgi:NADH dehydrogenase [ubiquinone] 1 alpha subcomplex assembly factor 7